MHSIDNCSSSSSSLFSLTDEDVFFDVPTMLANAQQQSKEVKKTGGSIVGRAQNVDRGHLDGHLRLFQDYFSENPTYDERTFKRRFRVSSERFKNIVYEEKACSYSFFYSSFYRSRIIILATLSSVAMQLES